MDVFEVINTTRAMRRLKPDPVPDELVWKVLDAAIRAPSGGNRQPWNFIVVRDETAKKKIAEWYLEAWNASYGPMKDAMAANPDAARMFNSADHLANHLAEVPVVIIAAIRGGDTGTSPAGSYVYPAIQNMMLAARALGLGTTLTTLHRAHEIDVKELPRHSGECADASAHSAGLAEGKVRNGRAAAGGRGDVLGEMGRYPLALTTTNARHRPPGQRGRSFRAHPSGPDLPDRPSTPDRLRRPAARAHVRAPLAQPRARADGGLRHIHDRPIAPSPIDYGPRSRSRGGRRGGRPADSRRAGLDRCCRDN